MSNYLLLELAVYVLFIIGGWKVFEKAGKPGWAAIIPIYNFIVMLEIVGKPWWWLILMLIPVVNIIFWIWMLNLLSKSYGYGVGFTIGLILLFPIFILILGFGGSSYKGAAGK